jgi:hypothetical protein
MRLAASALIIAAIAATPTFASGGNPYVLKMETVGSGPGQRGQVEVLSYGWGSAPATGDDHEIEYTVGVGKAPPPPGGAGKFGAVSGAHRDADRTAVGGTVGNKAADGEEGASGDPDRPIIAGSVPNDGAARESKLQALRARAVADIAKPPPGRSSVWIRVATPWAACRVGARYPAMTLSGNGRGHRLEDVRVSSCAADRISLRAERIRAWDKAQE